MLVNDNTNILWMQIYGCHCLITLLGDANVLAPVTFSQSAYLLIGILRRWSCIISLLYVMDLNNLLDIIY